MPSFICSKSGCEKLTYVSPAFVDVHGKVIGGIAYCTECYVPEKPTIGWLKTRAEKSNLFNFFEYTELSTEQKENYCRKILRMKKLTKQDKKSDTSEKKDR